MKSFSILAGCIAFSSCTASAVPQPLADSTDQPTPTVQQRGLASSLVNGLDVIVDGVVVNLVNGLLGQIHNAIEAGDRDGVLNAIEKLVPTATPTNVESASEVIEAVLAAEHTHILEYSSHLIANGIISGSVQDLLQYADGLASGKNGYENSVSEDKLRAAIYIPDTFTYGDKTPVILLPGTGTMGYTSFAGNFIPLLSESDWADPVWVNIPGKLLEDVQVNAEYAAYAVNYIAALTERNVTVLGWSQGNIDAQWAFKYWPSTRSVTSDHVAISADYRGTVLIDALIPLGLLNTPSTIQQGSDSELIRTLRSDGGDSGYVPTTSVFSGFFDEVVQPMSGTEASAYLLDARNVGVTNAEVQKVCPGQPGGTLYTHEGMLYNPLAFALAKDAILHDGPGDISRLDLADVCSTYLAPGLGLDDFLVTENAILQAGLGLVLYQPKPFTEPAIKAYATEVACVDP